MRHVPVFEIRGRSTLSLFLYIIVDIILFLGIMALIPFLFNEHSLFLFVWMTLILAISVTLFMVHLTHKVMMIKRVIIDGRFFYFFYEDRLKRKIALRDILKVSRNRISWPQVPIIIMFYKFIKISYRENRKFRSLYLTEDDFSKEELAMIFEEFKRYARERNKPIIEPGYMGDPFL